APGGSAARARAPPGGASRAGAHTRAPPGPQRAGAGRVNESLTEEQVQLRATVRELAEAEIAPVAEEVDREHRFPDEIVRRLGDLGFMGMTVPERLGGGGLDSISYAIAIEELARVDSSVAVTVAAHTSLGTAPIVLFGTEAQKDRWVPDLASGRRLA